MSTPLTVEHRACMALCLSHQNLAVPRAAPGQLEPHRAPLLRLRTDLFSLTCPVRVNPPGSPVHPTPRASHRHPPPQDCRFSCPPHCCSLRSDLQCLPPGSLQRPCDGGLYLEDFHPQLTAFLQPEGSVHSTDLIRHPPMKTVKGFPG